MATTTSGTCWSLIQAAAAGDSAARAEFAEIYGPIIDTYLTARWRLAPQRLREAEDARQEVILECLKAGGALERVAPNRSFRKFLRGVVRNVAARFEQRAGCKQHEELPSESRLGSPDSHEQADRAFDREWARLLVKQAALWMASRAVDLGAPAQRRVELLRLRFQEGIPIREIARRWNRSPERLHKDYAKARMDFENALRRVVMLEHLGEPTDLDAECAELIRLLE